MNLDDQFRRYFGTDDLGSIPGQAVSAGIERMLVDLGLEQDRGRRFALWTLLFMLGSAPDLETVFESSEDRDLARDFMALSDSGD